VLGVPQLSSDEDLGTRDATSTDAISNVNLVAVYCCAINVATASLERCLNGALDVARFCLPGAKAHGRYLRASIECEVCVERHDPSNQIRNGLWDHNYENVGKVRIEVCSERRVTRPWLLGIALILFVMRCRSERRIFGAPAMVDGSFRQLGFAE
jgi:hypothetical protein